MLKRTIAKILLLSMLSMTCIVPLAQAGLVGTQTLLHQQQGEENRARLDRLLHRTDLMERLQQAGVNPADVQARVNALSDQEVAALLEQFEQLPAGGDALGWAITIFLILLVTDILGYTDIFPFVVKR
jgi:hypothetical protein